YSLNSRQFIKNTFQKIEEIRNNTLILKLTLAVKSGAIKIARVSHPSASQEMKINDNKSRENKTLG
ncbi:MAG: hypothetical protein ACREPR_21500, partial [Brasilonema sp.]